MKKILLLAIAVVFTALMAAPSFAIDVTFDGQYRVRAIAVDNIDFNDDVDDYSSWIDQRFRLGITAKEAPVTGYVQLEIGGGGPNSSRVWGTTADSGAGFLVSARQAYLDFPVGPLQFRVGRTFESHSFLGKGIYDNVSDRYIVSYKASPELAISFIHAKGRESSPNVGTNTIAAGTANDNDRNIYNLGFTYKPQGAPFDLAARVYYVRDGGSTGFTQAGASTTAAGTWDAWWLTADTNIKLDPIKIYLSAAYLTGDTEPASGSGYDLKGYALHADVNAAFGPAKVGVVGGIGSGDDNTGDNDLETFFAPDGASYVHSHIFWHSGASTYTYNFMDSASIRTNLNTQNGSRQTLSNVTWYGAYADYKVNDDLTLSAKVAQFKVTEELAGKSDDIGEEYDLTANYKLHKGLSLFAFAAWFEPDDAITGGGAAKDDTVSEYYARVQWDF